MSITTEQLKKYSIFSGISACDLEQFLPHFHKRAFSKGVYLFYPRSSSLNTYFIESGLVRLFFINAHGEEFLLNLLRPPSVFGLPVLRGEQLRIMGAASYQDSVILSVSSEYLAEMMKTMPQLAHNLYEEASTSARMLLNHTRSLVTLNLNERLASLLIRMARTWQSADMVEIPISQAELAGWLGASRGRLNRALVELQNNGLIRVETGYIHFIDRKGLENLAEMGT